MGFLQSAYVIARRDFTATVYSKTFLLFLLGPLLIIGISVLFGTVTQRAAQQDIRATVGIVASEADYRSIEDAHERLAPAFQGNGLPDLRRFEPESDADAQVKQLLGSTSQRIVAVLTGGLQQPTLTGSVNQDGTIARQLGVLIEDVRQRQTIERAGAALPSADIKVVPVQESAGGLATARAMTARAGQLLLFMLTVLLAGMLLSNLIEEKSNKVIEVLAAAVPVDAIFVGKVFAMLAVSLVGIAVWTAGGAAATAMFAGGGEALPEPAVGWPLFMLLVLLYYTANYLLLGALFLGIGSQASSVREVQTLSMPVTVGQMMIFLLASFAVGPFNSAVGIGAAIFPFSSPLTMIARAAQTPEIWPHAVALLWQAIWVWLTVLVGAALFRRNVLKSGGTGAGNRPKKKWFRSAAG